MKTKNFLLGIMLLSSFSYAQYNKYTVLDYFMFIPKQYITYTFESNNTGDAIERKQILNYAFVDVKNGYIAQNDGKSPDQINEFVVWKSKIGKDVVGISGRLNFKSYNGADSSELDPVSGMNQYMGFFQFYSGTWITMSNFLPEKNELFTFTQEKFPSLVKYKKSWRFATVFPRSGTTVRIVLYIRLDTPNKSELIVKDLYKILWNGTKFTLTKN